MATDKTLALRAIQPRLRPGGLPQPNPVRREKKALAKKLGISTRRAARLLRQVN